MSEQGSRMRLQDKVCFVTGGTSGVGAGMVKRFAREGAKVAFIGRRKELGEQVAAEVADTGGAALFVQADLTVDDDIRLAVAQTVEKFGKLDVLVNNAAATVLTMTGADKPIHEQTLEEFQSIHDVDVYGIFRTCKYSIPEMINAGGGSIINVSSIASTVGLPSTPAYACGKGGVNAMTRTLAVDYAPYKIRANTIVLGLVYTELLDPFLSMPGMIDTFKKIQLTRVAHPEDVAHLGVYFASDESECVTGVEFIYDSGLTVRGAAPTDVLIEVSS